MVFNFSNDAFNFNQAQVFAQRVHVLFRGSNRERKIVKFPRVT